MVVIRTIPTNTFRTLRPTGGTKKEKKGQAERGITFNNSKTISWLRASWEKKSQKHSQCTQKQSHTSRIDTPTLSRYARARNL